ncbi:MAG: hypothetical protein AAFY57_16765 [Cyanobacteria bacterium J06642_2]
MTARFQGQTEVCHDLPIHAVSVYRRRPIADFEAVASERVRMLGTSPALTTFDLVCHCVTKGFDFIHRPDRVNIVAWQESNVCRQMLFPTDTPLEVIHQWVSERHAQLYPNLVNFNAVAR